MGDTIIGQLLGGENAGQQISVTKGEDGISRDENGTVYSHLQVGTIDFFQKVEDEILHGIEGVEDWVLTTEATVEDALGIDSSAPTGDSDGTAEGYPGTGPDPAEGASGSSQANGFDMSGHAPGHTLPVEGPEADETPEDGVN